MSNSENELQTVRIVIDGKWTASEMGRSLDALDDLYNLHVYTRAELPRRLWKRLGRHFPFPPEMFFEEFGPFLPWGRLSATSFEPGRESGDMLAGMSATLRAVREVDSDVVSTSPLLVRSVRYGSEGFKDITGVGEIIGHIKDFILRLIEIFATRKHRQELIEQAKLENQERRRRLDHLDIEIQKEKLEVVSQYIQVLKDAGYSKSQIKRAMEAVDDRADLFGALIEQGKIKAITSATDNDERE